MKKSICVTIDMDAYLIAKQKLPNLSAYINESLRALSGITKTEIKREEMQEEIKKIDNSIQELSIKKSILTMEIKTFDEKIIEQKKAQEEAEAFNRWVCPVCKTQNLLENDRCNKCSMKTRNDRNTIIINTKENI